VKFAWLLALALALQSAPAPPDSVIEAQTREIASILRCPVCQGLSVQDSPEGLSQQMKGVIREQLRAGKTPEEIKAYFVSKYGEWILLRPEPKGFNLAVYLLPIAALLGGAAVVVGATRKWTRASATHAPADENELAPAQRNLDD
jgi:cytochrome c-type biogenesis protein CcmH